MPPALIRATYKFICINILKYTNNILTSLSSSLERRDMYVLMSSKQQLLDENNLKYCSSKVAGSGTTENRAREVDEELMREG